MNTAVRPSALVFGLFWLLASFSAGARELPEFTKLVERYGPAVVNISTKQKAVPSETRQIPGSPRDGEEQWDELFRRYFGEGPNGGMPPERADRSLGSGFIIDASGLILTNNHVVDGADEVTVRLSDRRELVAQVIGADKRSDIALIKVKADNLPVVKLGHSENLKVGEWVMAIGSPFGFDHSVSVGVVSALGRSLPSESYVPFIQTDVAINPGNSGGPLFNLDGEVVGINSQIYSRTGGFMGLSFAIPVDVAMNVVAQLKDKGTVTRGWLGVMIQDVTRELAESFGMERPSGALVAKVMENSPASKAGIQEGDVIVEFNGRTIDYSSDLPPLVGRAEVGKDARVKLVRERKPKLVNVRIAELPGEEQLAETGDNGGGANDDRLGIAVADLTSDQRRELGLGKQGLLVADVGPGPAYDAGLRRGDILLRLNNTGLESSAQLKKLVKELPAGKSIPVLVQRRNGPLFLALRLPEKK